MLSKSRVPRASVMPCSPCWARGPRTACSAARNSRATPRRVAARRRPGVHDVAAPRASEPGPAPGSKHAWHRARGGL